jgi:hypothetical protein
MAYGTYKARVAGLPPAYAGLQQSNTNNPYGHGNVQQETPPVCPPCRCPTAGVNGWVVLGLVAGAAVLGVAIAS